MVVLIAKTPRGSFDRKNTTWYSLDRKNTTWYSLDRKTRGNFNHIIALNRIMTFHIAGSILLITTGSPCASLDLDPEHSSLNLQHLGDNMDFDWDVLTTEEYFDTDYTTGSHCYLHHRPTCYVMYNQSITYYKGLCPLFAFRSNR